MLVSAPGHGRGTKGFTTLGAQGVSIGVDSEEALVSKATPRSERNRPLRCDFVAAIGEFVPGVEQGQHGPVDNLEMLRPSSESLPAAMLADGTGVEGVRRPYFTGSIRCS